MSPDLKAKQNKDSSRRDASEEELRDWAESCFGAPAIGWTQISGGNRCRSWLISFAQDSGAPQQVYLRYQPPREPSAEPYTVWREATIYKAIEKTEVTAPRLLAVHGSYQAIITTAAEGRADFRRLTDHTQKNAIAREFVQALARLHAVPFSELPAVGLAAPGTIAECVRGEIGIWSAMYDETRRTDPLIELALKWLTSHVPEPEDPPVLVHGDAGPGNFLFQGPHMTGLVDWELAHPGDPMEDLAWLCMRNVMEPVPDFTATLAEYERASGRRISLTRLLYHRVFVTLRVVVIRHRNVTGLPGNSIISRSLNRRLLVDALAAAQDVALPIHTPIPAGATDRTEYYNGVLADLRSLSEGESAKITEFAKNTAKVIKYLREYDRIGREAERREKRQIEDLIGIRCADLPEARRALARDIAAGTIDFDPALRTLSALVSYEAQLAAPSSGRMAERGFPPLSKET